jgi:hypothetical protein
MARVDKEEPNHQADEQPHETERYGESNKRPEP